MCLVLRAFSRHSSQSPKGSVLSILGYAYDGGRISVQNRLEKRHAGGA